MRLELAYRQSIPAVVGERILEGNRGLRSVPTSGATCRADVDRAQAFPTTGRWAQKLFLEAARPADRCQRHCRCRPGVDHGGADIWMLSSAACNTLGSISVAVNARLRDSRSSLAMTNFACAPAFPSKPNGHRCAQCNGKPDGQEEPVRDGDGRVPTLDRVRIASKGPAS